MIKVIGIEECGLYESIQKKKIAEEAYENACRDLYEEKNKRLNYLFSLKEELNEREKTIKKWEEEIKKKEKEWYCSFFKKNPGYFGHSKLREIREHNSEPKQINNEDEKLKSELNQIESELNRIKNEFEELKKDREILQLEMGKMCKIFGHNIRGYDSTFRDDTEVCRWCGKTIKYH